MNAYEGLERELAEARSCEKNVCFDSMPQCVEPGLKARQCDDTGLDTASAATGRLCLDPRTG